MRKALCVLFAAIMALLSLAGTASAAPNVLINPAIAADVAVRAVPAQALSCNPGDMCAWPVSDGSSNRCSWTNADTDWHYGSVRCSWSPNNAVWAVANNGQNKNYAGVCLYANANYGNWQIWVRRGYGFGGVPGVKIRSHRWVQGESC